MSHRLALGAGYTVAATAGSANQSYIKNLGATYCFDHKDRNVVGELLKVLKTGDVVFDAIASESSQKLCAELISRIGGGKLPVVLWPLPTEYENVEPVLGKFKSCPNRLAFVDVADRIVNSGDPGLVNLDLGDAVWRKYIPQALAAGNVQAKPDPLVLEGLERVQEGINILRKGVSAKKIVIEVAKDE